MREVVEERDLTGLGAAVERAHQLYVGPERPDRRRCTGHGKLITVFSPKGGVGKTTLAVNLALALADKGARKVCLVDLDLGLRRHRDHPAAVPGPHHRRRRRTESGLDFTVARAAADPARATR